MQQSNTGHYDNISFSVDLGKSFTFTENANRIIHKLEFRMNISCQKRD